jgi:hypothetical protein
MRRIVRSRKGQAEEDDETFPWLTAAAIAVMVLLLIMLLYQKIYVGTAGSPEEAQCRASIVAHARIVYASGGDLISQIVCTPKQVTISTENEENAKRQLAETMKTCWDRWQRGTPELFKDNGIYCNPCAFVSFQGGRDSLTNFPAYLSATNITKDGPTYAVYLSSSSSQYAQGNVPAVGANEPQQLLSTKTDYAVLFVTAKGKSNVAFLKDHFWDNPARSTGTVVKGSIRGAAVGGVGASIGIIGAAALGLAVPGPGWVVTGIVVLGVAGGAIGGGMYTYEKSTVELPEWVSQVELVPNDADYIAKLGCRKVEQQGPSQLKTKDV